jgi:hypothetical protein
MKATLPSLLFSTVSIVDLVRKSVAIKCA